MKNQITICMIMLLMVSIGWTQSSQISKNISIYDNYESVLDEMTRLSESVKTIDIKSPLFPLAKESEVHLICHNVKTQHGLIAKAVFSFSDDQLNYIEATGNIKSSIYEHQTDTARTYMNYAVFFKDGLFVDLEEDRAWVLSKEAMHVNLFTWKNPYLLSDESSAPKEFNQKIPAFLKMGATYELLKADLEKNSSFTHREELDGSDPNAQYQINCFGVNYLGFPRKVEARFGNDRLNVVWILTGKGEEDRIRQALINEFGPPVYENKDWEIYNNWQVGLRKDKPEILLIEQELGLVYKKNYFKQ